MDPHELAERERLAQEEAARVKRELPRIRVETPSSDGDGASPTEGAAEDGQFGDE
jgi:hypothetical protein